MGLDVRIAYATEEVRMQFETFQGEEGAVHPRPGDWSSGTWVSHPLDGFVPTSPWRSYGRPPRRRHSVQPHEERDHRRSLSSSSASLSAAKSHWPNEFS